MTRDEWIETFCGLIGTDPPSPEEIETMLELAGVAAHSSERTAAPIACWLVGRAGVAPDAGLATARAVVPD
jgi:hypothetical protein